MKQSAIAALASTATAAALIGAPIAHADQYDYVNSLDNRGVYYESISDVIDLGKFMCMRLRNGISPQWAPMPAVEFGYSKTDAAIILIEAVENMCSDQMPVVTAYINGTIPESPPPGSNAVPTTPHPCTTANPPAGCADGSY